MSAAQARVGGLVVHLYQCNDGEPQEPTGCDEEAPLPPKDEDSRGSILVPCLCGASYADLVASLEERLSQFCIVHGPGPNTADSIALRAGDDNGDEETLPLLPTQSLSSDSGSGGEGPRTISSSHTVSYHCRECQSVFGHVTTTAAAWGIKVHQLQAQEDLSPREYGVVCRERLTSAVSLESHVRCFFRLAASAAGRTPSTPRVPIVGARALPEDQLQLPSHLTVRMGDTVLRVGCGADGMATVMEAVVARVRGTRRDRELPRRLDEVPLPAPRTVSQADPRFYLVDTASGACVLPCERVAVIAALVSSLQVLDDGEGGNAAEVPRATQTTLRGARPQSDKAGGGAGQRHRGVGLGSVISMSDIAGSSSKGGHGGAGSISSSTRSSDHGFRLTTSQRMDYTNATMVYVPRPQDGAKSDGMAGEEADDPYDIIAFTPGGDAYGRAARSQEVACYAVEDAYDTNDEEDEGDNDSETDAIDFVYRGPRQRSASPSQITTTTTHTSADAASSSAATLVNRDASRVERLASSDGKRVQGPCTDAVSEASESRMEFGFDEESASCEESRAASDPQPVAPGNSSSYTVDSFSASGVGRQHPLEYHSDNSNSIPFAQRPASTPPPLAPSQLPQLQEEDSRGLRDGVDAFTPPVLAPQHDHIAHVGDLELPSTSGRKRPRSSGRSGGGGGGGGTTATGQAHTPTLVRTQGGRSGQPCRTPIPLVSPGPLHSGAAASAAARPDHTGPPLRERIFYTPEGVAERGSNRSSEDKDSSWDESDGPITLSSARPLRSATKSSVPLGSLAFASARRMPNTARHDNQPTSTPYMFSTPQQDTVKSQQRAHTQEARGDHAGRHHSRLLALLSPQPPVPPPLHAFQPVVRPPSLGQREDVLPTIMVTQQQLPEYDFHDADDSDEEGDDNHDSCDRSGESA